MKEVVEFTRLVQPADASNDAVQRQIAPSGRRAFLVTRRGEISTDKNHFEVLLLDLEPSRLESGRPRVPERLFAVESLKDKSVADPSIQGARWADDNNIVLRARVDDQHLQVFSLNTETRRVSQLTFADRPVMAFGVSSDLGRVVYAVHSPAPLLPPGARSLVVENNRLWSVLFGRDDANQRLPSYQYFVADTARTAPPRALGKPVVQGFIEPDISVSPDGQWALLRVPELGDEHEWLRRYPSLANWFQELMPLDLDPLRYFSRADAVTIKRRVIFRLADGEQRYVIDAPDSAIVPSELLVRSELWLPAGSVVIAGTYVPLEGDAKTPESTGSHVIEYWPQSGRWSVVARLKGKSGGVSPLLGEPNGLVVVDDGKPRRFRRRSTEQWAEVGAEAEIARDVSWTLQVRQALNQPPDVFAIGPAAQAVKLTDLNPQFSPSRWHVVQPYSWVDREGRKWDGGLIVPNHVDLSERSKRYPLVIQTYGFSVDNFYLDGNNESQGFTSAFPGRALGREGIPVLAMPWAPTSTSQAGPRLTERQAIKRFMDGVSGAIESLVNQGVVDRERIGIIGFSATGDRVNYLLTFGDVPIRAATIADGVSSSLFSVVATYGFSLASLRLKEIANDSEPYGDSVGRWAGNDPSLNTHCITAAVRIEAYGTFLHSHWDTYALLRRQYKPVEMIVVPDGAHNLSRPSERVISLQGNVDWFRFWLKGEERIVSTGAAGETDVSLREQYVRWRQLAHLKTVDERKPRCRAGRWLH